MARILVIEDEEMNREALRDMLEIAGHQTVWASNGVEGLRMFGRRSVDLVITDLMMPQKDGLETIQELRQADPEVKIIAIAAGGYEILSRAKELGADAIIEKPFRMNVIVEAVEEVLQGGA